MATKPIPDGYHSVTPYLMVSGAPKLVEFIKKAFDGQETERMHRPDGSIGHAELRIGDSVVMLAEAQGQSKPMPTSIYLYVKDADATYNRALQAGGISTQAPSNQFFGDRSGAIKDPAGNHWWIATRIEDVPRQELEKRAQSFWKEQQAQV
jgi:PhnB protein